MLNFQRKLYKLQADKRKYKGAIKQETENREKSNMFRIAKRVS